MVRRTNFILAHTYLNFPQVQTSSRPPVLTENTTDNSFVYPDGGTYAEDDRVIQMSRGEVVDLVSDPCVTRYRTKRRENLVKKIRLIAKKGDCKFCGFY